MIVRHEGVLLVLTRKVTVMDNSSRALFVRVRHEEVPAPNACRWCGYEERGHGMYSSRSVGIHTWVAPTSAQRKARMLARRNARR